MKHVIADDRVIVGLDVNSLSLAEALLKALADGKASRCYKIGLRLFTSPAGPHMCKRVKDFHAKLFLDTKLHDTPTTVRDTAYELVHVHQADLITVHTAGGPSMLQAAVEGAHEAREDVKVLGVTVLTSMDLTETIATGTNVSSIDELVLLRAKLAQECGCDGVIASAQEARTLRTICGPQFMIVTPGVRLLQDPTNDQKRVATPGKALFDGADAVVVARPICTSNHPRAAFEAYVANAAAGLQARNAR